MMGAGVVVMPCVEKVRIFLCLLTVTNGLFSTLKSQLVFVVNVYCVLFLAESYSLLTAASLHD